MAENLNLTNDYLFKRTFGYVRTRKHNQNLVPKYATKWNFREENYPEYILIDALEIYIIELPKLTRY